MFFNSFDRKLKKSYGVLNPMFKDKIFPMGEKEYLYVGMTIKAYFGENKTFPLIQTYASVYTYFGLEGGNIATTYDYARRKCTGMLNDDETALFVAIVVFNASAPKDSSMNPIDEIQKYKKIVIDQVQKAQG